VGASLLVLDIVSAGPVAGFPYVENPLAPAGAVGERAASIHTNALWPFAVAPLAVWLWTVARRAVFRRVAAIALVIPFASLGLTLAGAEDWLWVVLLAFVVLLVDVTVVTARRERLWGMPALMSRTATWAALSAVVAVVYVVLVPLAALRTGAVAIVAGLVVAAAARAYLERTLRARIVGVGVDALAQLHRGLEHGAAAPVLAEAAEDAVRASHAAVDVMVDGRRLRLAGGEAEHEQRVSLPIVDAGDVVGFLALMLPVREELDLPERRLLGELATAAAAALNAERRTLELAARLDRLRPELPLGEAYAATAELVADTRRLAHELAEHELDPGSAVGARSDTQLTA
jgi:hypothetical protein